MNCLLLASARPREDDGLPGRSARVRNNNHGHAEHTADGVVFGAMAGYNYQLTQNVVLGVEADIGYFAAKNTTEVFDKHHTLQQYGAIGSVRGRVGYTFNHLMFYGPPDWSYRNYCTGIRPARRYGW